MSDHKHLYNRARWVRMRTAQLMREPLCRMHRELGQLVSATVADHVKPHRGDEELFFDPDNLQSLCKRCHDAHKQAQEHQADGLLRGAGLNGRPLDLAHPWHRPARAEIGPAGGSTLRTMADDDGDAIEPSAPHAAPRRAMREGQGGGEKSAAMAPDTARVPPFAKCQNSMGGA
jgi:hypothetical protein